METKGKKVMLVDVHNIRKDVKFLVQTSQIMVVTLAITVNKKQYHWESNVRLHEHMVDISS